jgi:DNA-directed RNA polymerase specialized sigma24 family protein
MANYVDKTEFLTDIGDYQLRKLSNPDEQIPEFSAICIKKMAEKIGNRPNFIGYSYKDDMVSDGIYVCLKYFDKFNPEKSSNPFGYFSQCIWFAFLQRIAKEKRQTAIRSKILSSAAFEVFNVQGHDEDSEFQNSYTTFLQEHNHVETEVIKVKKDKTKAKGRNIMEIVEDELETSDVSEELDEVLRMNIEDIE